MVPTLFLLGSYEVPTRFLLGSYSVPTRFLLGSYLVSTSPHGLWLPERGLVLKDMTHQEAGQAAEPAEAAGLKEGSQHHT